MNMIDINKLKRNQVPFYSWECITLYCGIRDINLVIRNEKRMDEFLKMLIYTLNTVDGNRDSGLKIQEKLKE